MEVHAVRPGDPLPAAPARLRPKLPGKKYRLGPAFAPPPVPAQVLAPPEKAPAVQPIDADGLARGCRVPSSVRIGQPVNRDLGMLLPSWVQATPRRNAAPDPKPRAVEGVLTESRISGSDFPLKPWHTYYDWNYLVRPLPWYRDLLSTANPDGVLECEWDTRFLPSYAWGQRGQRVWILGRWIYDCEHPTRAGYRTEIHPPKAVAVVRYEAASLLGNPRGPVHAAVASVYLGRHDTYWTSTLNDQDYDFNMILPRRPKASARPRVSVRSMTGPLPVEPFLSPLPSGNALHVHIPMSAVRSDPDEYGLTIACGWSDDDGVETAKIIRRTVIIEKIHMDANLDPVARDEWYVYVCVNGRWKSFESLSGDAKSLNYKVDLDLHPTDKIRISLCGFEADTVHDRMGSDSGVAPARTSSPSTDAQAEAAAKKIRSSFLGGLFSGWPDENDRVSTLFVQHDASEQGRFLARPEARDYRLRYSIT